NEAHYVRTHGDSPSAGTVPPSPWGEGRVRGTAASPIHPVLDANPATSQTHLPNRKSQIKNRKLLTSLAAAFLLACSLCAAPAQDLLQKVDDSLFIESKDGNFRVDLSGLFDLEGYFVDQRPPGLIFGGNDEFINPRLSLFLDARYGEHFYVFVQGRADRGFDPRARKQAARLDEYFLRYTPFKEPTLNFQVGKFATVFGNWVPRHDSWNNPFITAPLPYENVMIITDQTAPGGPAGFLGRRATPDLKGNWLPILWGPTYASGASVFGRIEKFDYAFDVKNASISSRPTAWDGMDLGWENPTFTGRVGYRPNASWNFGMSASGGTYLLPPARPVLPPGTGLGDFNQITFGQDASWSWRHWQVWAEWMFSRFEVPNVGNADTAAYYLEAKYKITPNLFAALRWNQQVFDDVPDGAGGQQPWDRDIWRIDSAVGYRFTRHLQGKLQYSYSHQKGPFQQGEQLVAAQVTVKF
ncbi:MAG: hypothetical protein AB1705_28315, partial [Verrucomicrobiota bacterium]